MLGIWIVFYPAELAGGGCYVWRYASTKAAREKYIWGSMEALSF